MEWAFVTVLLPAPVSERATDLAGVRTDVVVRCDRNESAYPPLPAVVSALRDTAASAHRYPSFRPDGLRATIAEHTGVEAAHISVGAGATAVLSAILQDSAARARARVAPNLGLSPPHRHSRVSRCSPR